MGAKCNVENFHGLLARPQHREASRVHTGHWLLELCSEASWASVISSRIAGVETDSRMRALVEPVADPAALLATKPLIAREIRRAIRGLLREIVRSLGGVFRNGHAAMSLSEIAATNGTYYDSLSVLASASMVAHVHTLILELAESPGANGVLSMLPRSRFALNLCACAGRAAVPANLNQPTDKDVQMTAFKGTHPSHGVCPAIKSLERYLSAPAPMQLAPNADSASICGGRAS